MMCPLACLIWPGTFSDTQHNQPSVMSVNGESEDGYDLQEKVSAELPVCVSC